MNLIKNLKIRSKLLLLLSLLLFPLLYFVAATISQEMDAYEKLQQEEIQLTESEKISALIHAFQRERARILVAAEGDTAMLVEARAQRNLTDATTRDLHEFLARTGRTMPELALMNELKRFRNNLDQNAFNSAEFRDFTTDLIFAFLDRIDANATGISNADLEVQLKSFRSLAETKIQLARIRSLLMKMIQGKNILVEDYAVFRSHRNFYTFALRDFNRVADGPSVRAVQDVMASENYKKVEVILQQVEANPQLNLAPYDPSAVFSLFTRSIEDFREAENNLIDRIRSKVDNEMREKQRFLVTLSVLLIIVLVATSLLSFYIVSLISSSLATLKTAADRIKLGATDVVIDIDSKDEIGKVADSFKGVVEKNIYLSDVARAIGEGKYDMDVMVQSNEDVLSYAIRDMKENLHRFTAENADRNWILTGISELNNLTSGETELERVSEKVISFLSAYTGSDAGVLYLHNGGGKLEPAAGYGVQHTVEHLPTFTIGSGKVGQAVKEQRLSVLEGVAEEHMRIKTGLSEIEPSSVIIVPLQFYATVVGAVELCSRQHYSELQLQFFRAAAERIAVVVHTLKAHLQTQELLYETQNQAEELETQQEELRQLNSELKASEEELRVNQEELQEKNSELEEKAQLLEEQFEAIRSKNKALEDARAAVELKMQQVETVSKYKSDFLANMSHELRTPLNSILILSKLLADNPGKTLTEKQTDHAQIIHRSGNDLLKLINEILDLSKIESGMIKLETEEIRLDDIKLEPMFREVAARKKIRLTETHEKGSFDTIVTDRFRLEQILKNFIGNALKFTDEGGEVEITVYPVTKKPRFRSAQLREQQDIVAFAVRDTGIGIPEDKQDVVFEAFQQVDSSTTRKYGGTGLGLTISKELATLLGGGADAGE